MIQLPSSKLEVVVTLFYTCTKIHITTTKKVNFAVCNLKLQGQRGGRKRKGEGQATRCFLRGGMGEGPALHCSQQWLLGPPGSNGDARLIRPSVWIHKEMVASG